VQRRKQSGDESPHSKVQTKESGDESPHSKQSNSMNRVGVIDYGMCNLDSVARAVQECGGEPVVSGHPHELAGADRLILPGVGAFADAMWQIRQRGLDAFLHEQVLGKGVPLLGICLGMQLLARKGWEGGETEGLGIVEGEVRRLLPTGDDSRIPHVGWNEVEPLYQSPLFAGITPRTDFYFVHSYHVCPSGAGDALARTPYAGGFVSAVARGSVFGVQFHPEKSQRPGFRVLKNFLAI
jgi:glutamine amidotransferase